MNKIQLKRLNNLIKVLNEASCPDGECPLYMGRYFNACGTPACVLGHYASRTDIQRLLRPGKRRHRGFMLLPVGVKSGRSVTYEDALIHSHFGIYEYEAEELFSALGCGRAQTTEEAAEYIKKFIKRKLAKENK